MATIAVWRRALRPSAGDPGAVVRTYYCVVRTYCCVALTYCCVALTCGCDEAARPTALAQLTVPPVVRVGSPVYAVGRSLSGRTVLLEGAPVAIPLMAAGQHSDGSELAYGHVPAHAEWKEGQGLGRGCLTGPDLAGWQTCVAARAQFRTAWLPVTHGLTAPNGWSWGELCVLKGEDLLLPGEGSQHVEVEVDGEVRTIALVTRPASGRQRGELALSPHWLGPKPGPKRFRARVVGEATQEPVHGPWGPWQDVHVAAPVLHESGLGWRRGDLAPVAAKGVPDAANWAVQWSGHWLQAQAAGDPPPGPPALFTTPGGSGGFSPISSPWWWSEVPLRSQALGFAGQARVVVWRGSEVWDGPWLSVKAPVLPTLQRIEVVGGTSWHAALERFGLAHHAKMVESKILSGLRHHFALASVQVHWTAWPSADGRETLRLWLGDLDPNGLHLVGAETSLAGTGKDDGNLHLGEQLGGFDSQAWAAGGVPLGGVFVGELMAFSRQLFPNSAHASAEFDQAFGPFSPQLGGQPAPPSPNQATSKAVAHLAAAVAEACAHEIGHALGMPAATPSFHWPSDDPGRIMDSGNARPWAERAGLAAAPPSRWGPVDEAYLRRILPLRPRPSLR